jgi:hypothetical protein
MTYPEARKWSDRFLPEMKRIIGEHLIGAAPVDEDQERCTDLIVLKLDAVRIACRVRKYIYMAPYGHQFTIRQKVAGGYKTELTKIIEGWGDYMLYAFAAEDEVGLAKWTLGSLNALRIHIARQLAQKRVPWLNKSNGDGDSDFAVFNINDVPDFIFANFPLDGRRGGGRLGGNQGRKK